MTFSIFAVEVENKNKEFLTLYVDAQNAEQANSAAIACEYTPLDIEVASAEDRAEMVTHGIIPLTVH